MSKAEYQALLARGISAAGANDLPRARMLLRTASEREPEGIDAWLWLAQTAETPADALTYLRRALRVAPDHARARLAFQQLLLREGIAAAKAQAKDRARLLLRELCTIAPSEERAWLWRASVAERYDEAIDCLTRVLELHPGHPQAQTALDRLRQRMASRGAQPSPAPGGPVPAAPPTPSVAAPAPPHVVTPPAIDAPPHRPVPPVSLTPGVDDGATASVTDHRPPHHLAAAPPESPQTIGRAAPPPSTSQPVTPVSLRADLPAPPWPSTRRSEIQTPSVPPPADGLGSIDATKGPPRVGGLHVPPPAPPPRENPLGLRDAFPAPVEAPTLRVIEGRASPSAARQPAAEEPSGARTSPLDAGPAKPSENVEPAPGIVLVVDDSPTVLKVVTFALKKHGLEVVTAPGGPEALELLKSVTPDLVLLDINMPGMDGYQVCRTIRREERTSRIPVVMLSGKDGFFDKIRGRMAGAVEYITKPFEPAELMTMLGKYFPVRLSTTSKADPDPEPSPWSGRVLGRNA